MIIERPTPGDQGATSIGHRHTISWQAWRPNRELNPQYADLPDIEEYAVIVEHVRPDGRPCVGSAVIDSPAAAAVSPDGAKWRMVERDPLTLEPSLLCSCGDHGWIKNGRWLPAS